MMTKKKYSREVKLDAISLGRVGTAHVLPASTNVTWWALPTLLAEIFVIGRGTIAAAPILGINAGTDVTMKCRPRPIDRAVHVAVFDGIPMDVIHMPVEILLVPYLVLPKSPLPNGAFAMLGLRTIDPRLTP